MYLSTCLISFSFAPFCACLVVTFLGWVRKFDSYEEFDFQFTLLGSGGIFHHFCHFQPHFLGPPSILTFGQIRTCQCIFQCAIVQPIQATNTSFVTEHNLIWSFSHHSTHQLLLCGPPTFASAAAAFEIVPDPTAVIIFCSKKPPRMNFLPIFLPTFDCSPAVNIRDLLSLVFQKVPGCVFPTLLLLFLCLPLTFLMKRVAKPKTVDPRATRP